MLSSAGSRTPSVGVRCALGTGGGTGPEGGGPGAASFPHPALPSARAGSHVGCGASGRAAKQSRRCPGHARTSLVSAGSHELREQLRRVILHGCFGNARRALVNLRPDTDSLHTYGFFGLSCSHPVLCLEHFLDTMLPSQSLSTLFLLSPAKPSLLLSFLSCPSALAAHALFFSRHFLSIWREKRAGLHVCGTSQTHSGCVIRDSPGVPIARAAHMIHRLLQRDPKGLVNPSIRQKSPHI